ncbi:MAG: SAM-dependent methyltransferase [Bdellovibrio sp. 28-41-41]|nr:MAG: SAM-dependent methyltransferase [Bdellovibrio sp. 28-41-41]
MKNQWNDRYGQSEYYYGTAPNTFLVDQVNQFEQNAKVLCLAEGEGRNAVFLAKKGFQVTAVDSSQVGLDKLAELAVKNNVVIDTICCDLNEFVFEDSYWSGIVSIWCHLPSELRTKVHKGVVFGLKPGGIFVLEAYRPEQLKFRTGGPQNADLMPTLSQVVSELPGLKPVLAHEIERNVSEGIGHQGLSAVVQFVGTK